MAASCCLTDMLHIYNVRVLTLYSTGHVAMVMARGMLRKTWRYSVGDGVGEGVGDIIATKATVLAKAKALRNRIATKYKGRYQDLRVAGRHLSKSEEKEKRQRNGDASDVGNYGNIHGRRS